MKVQQLKLITHDETMESRQNDKLVVHTAFTLNRQITTKKFSSTLKSYFRFSNIAHFSKSAFLAWDLYHMRFNCHLTFVRARYYKIYRQQLAQWQTATGTCVIRRKQWRKQLQVQSSRHMRSVCFTKRDENFQQIFPHRCATKIVLKSRVCSAIVSALVRNLLRIRKSASLNI